MVRKTTQRASGVMYTLPYRKKNAPYLYDLMITHALDWPSLTCQWFPDKESCAFPHLALVAPQSTD